MIILKGIEIIAVSLLLGGAAVILFWGVALLYHGLG